MKNKLILIPVLVMFIVVSSQAQSYFKFITWTEQEVLNSTEIVITRDWLNGQGDQMYTILVASTGKTRKGVIHINRYSGRVDTYSLVITGAELTMIGIIESIATVRKTEEFVWVESTYNDAADLMRVGNEVYANFYDLDIRQ